MKRPDRSTKNEGMVSTEKNQGIKNIGIILTVIIVGLLITWVYLLAMKAEDTVSVVMYNQGVYKNNVITEDMLVEYKMIRAEFEKYSVVKNDGTVQRRIILWDERDKIINCFAAYPLKANTVAEYRDYIKSRIDNSDNVLYSFPGKVIINLDIGASDLQSFKTFLQPGDRINVVAVYKESEKITEEDTYGGQQTVKVDVFKEDEVFPDLMLADLLNGKGESILDIYASYNDKTAYQQAQLDASEAFQESITPKSMIVALTPEEEERYYYYLGKDNITFKISLPQRAE